MKGTPVLATAVENGALKVVGAWYSLDTGLVEIFKKTSQNEPERLTY